MEVILVVENLEDKKILEHFKVECLDLSFSDFCSSTSAQVLGRLLVADVAHKMD
jgi:hypothetical protein